MFPCSFTDPHTQVAFSFNVGTVMHFVDFPHRLGSPRAAVQYILPDVVESLVSHEENHGKTVDLFNVLHNHLGVATTAASEVVCKASFVLNAYDTVHQTLYPLLPIFRGTVQKHDHHQDSLPFLQNRLHEIVQVAQLVASSGILALSTNPRPRVPTFERACLRLLARAAGATANLSAKKWHQQTILAIDGSTKLLHQMVLCHGCLHALLTYTEHALSPIAVSMTQRAVMNFVKECNHLLLMACPEARSSIFPGGDPCFEDLRPERMHAFGPLIFDEWKRSVDTTSLSRDLLLLCNILKDFVKPQAQLRKTIRHIHQQIPHTTVFLHGFVSPSILLKAHEVAQMPPPPRNLTSVYRHLIKQQVRLAVQSPEGFNITKTLSFFLHFYETVKPPIYSSAILTLRVYQMYRALCRMLDDIPPCANVPISLFFQAPSETLVADPFCWMSTSFFQDLATLKREILAQDS